MSGPCSVYWGSDNTLCATHHGRFDSDNVSHCDAARAAAPPVEPRSDPEDGPNPWERREDGAYVGGPVGLHVCPACGTQHELPPPVREAGLRDWAEMRRGVGGRALLNVIAALLAEPVPLDGHTLFCRCECGAQGYDLGGGGDWFAQHLAAARLTDPKGASPVREAGLRDCGFDCMCQCHSALRAEPVPLPC